MDVVVILEFHKGEKVVPVILSLVDEEQEVLLELLINLFCLSVALRVVCSGGSQLDSKESVKFLHELCHKLGASIRYHFPGQSMMFLYVPDVKLGSSSSRKSGDHTYEVAFFGDGVFSVGFQQLHYEVNTDCFPRCVWNQKQV